MAGETGERRSEEDAADKKDEKRKELHTYVV